MASVELGLDAIQIQSIRPTSVQPFWLFDGNNNVADEVENLARRCRTVSPNMIKQELYNERRPHSTAGIPLHVNFCRNQREKRVKNGRQIHNTANMQQEDKFVKVLGKFQPQKIKEIVIGPGYVISKGKQEVTAKIKTGDFFDPEAYVQQVKKNQNRRPDDRDHTIEILKHQVDDLSAFLEEARVQHKMEIRKTIDQHKEEIEQMKKEHAEHLTAIEADHQEGINNLEESQRTTIESIREEANKERDQLARELKFMKAAFEAYKETVKEEMNSKWRHKELEIKLEFDRRSELLLSETRHEAKIQKNKELDNLSKEQRRQISAIVEANKKEMDILLRKFTASAADADRVHEAMVELQRMKSENSLLSNELDNTKKTYRVTQNELSDMKVHLQTYKEHFEEKVAEVDDRYSQKINGLMIDNSTLRKQYLKKCDELYKMKSNVDLKKDDTVATAKDIMQQLILSKTRADVSLTAFRDDPPAAAGSGISAHRFNTAKAGEKKGSNRPLSAPSTPKETALAVTTSSGEYAKSKDKRKAASRPASSIRINSLKDPVAFTGQPPSRVASANVLRTSQGQKRVTNRENPPTITLSPPRLKSNRSLSSHKGSSNHKL